MEAAASALAQCGPGVGFLGELASGRAGEAGLATPTQKPPRNSVVQHPPPQKFPTERGEGNCQSPGPGWPRLCFLRVAGLGTPAPRELQT